MNSLCINSFYTRNALAEIHSFIPEKQKKGKDGVYEIFQKHKCIQSDPINVAGRNADLSIQSCVSDYKEEYLIDLMYNNKKLIEYFCKMMSIIQAESFPIFKRKRYKFENRPEVRSFF